MDESPEPVAYDPRGHQTSGDAGSCPWDRVALHVALSSLALADLDDVGGIAGAARERDWSRDQITAAAVALAMLRNQIDVQLARLKDRMSDPDRPVPNHP